jgi:hypothetical protein
MQKTRNEVADAGTGKIVMTAPARATWRDRQASPGGSGYPSEAPTSYKWETARCLQFCRPHIAAADGTDCPCGNRCASSAGSGEYRDRCGLSPRHPVSRGPRSHRPGVAGPQR